MPSVKKAAKKASKKSIKKAAAEKLVVEVRKIRPQLVSAGASIDRVLGDKASAKAHKKLAKRMKTARKAITKVVALLGE